MLITDYNKLCCSSRVLYCSTNAGFLEAEAAEADVVEYLHQFGNVAGVVDGCRQLDQAEMSFTFVDLGSVA